MELKMTIENVKTIKKLEFSFPLESGLYAITGENSSGKSTLVTCASSVFFNMPMYDYIGRPSNDAMIEFQMNGAIRRWTYRNNQWSKNGSDERMKVNGFYEGSIIFGNRFRDTMFSKVKTLDRLTVGDLEPADEYVRKNLGIILHDNENFYEKMYYVKESVCRIKGLTGSPYFYSTDGRFINQARMSTGENLLVSILHSLNILRLKRVSHNDGRPCIVFLDEIELALHASSLRRLVHFLTGFSETYGLAIFFSTHSLELIRGINPQNIYYLTRLFNGTITITNPCYPAYATRNLYSDDGYGSDFVIFVEDDIAKCVIERIMNEKRLIKNARVKVLPTGGWTNTIAMAYDVISSRLLLNNTKIIVVLDKDIYNQVPGFISNNPKYRDIKLNFLPISSLEKYIKKGLIDNLDQKLFETMDTYLFQKRPLNALLQEYGKTVDYQNDKDGKALYGVLLNELRGMRKGRDELVEIVLKHIIDTDVASIEELSNFLSTQFSSVE